MAELNLAELTFGHDYAERDAKQGFLSKVFLKTPLYNRIKNNQCELVIGRKGSGKSANCLILKDTFESEGSKVVLLTPESLSKQKIQALEISSINKAETYLQTWRYILLTKIAFEVVNLIEKLKLKISTNNSHLKSIRDFLKEQGEIEKDFGESLAGLIGVISKMNVKFWGVEGTLEANKVVKFNSLDSSLTKLQANLQKILTDIHQVNIIILIDKVDEIWDETEESKLMVSGLLRASRAINDSLPRIRSIAFLRSDIYDVLNFHDIDKYNGLTQRITWNETELKSLIENRAKISVKLDSSFDKVNIWDLIFEKYVDSYESFEYIESRTLKRPREIILFCTRALQIAQDAGHKKILQDDILSAEILYSTEKLRDLISEYNVQYPYLDSLLGIFQGFKARFTRDEYLSRYEEAKGKIEQLQPTLSFESANAIIQTLYYIGFLGAELDDAYIFFYNMPNFTLPQQDKYTIHPAFHSALGIQQRIIKLNDFKTAHFEDEPMGLNVGGDWLLGSLGSVSQMIARDYTINGDINIMVDTQDDVKAELDKLSDVFLKLQSPNQSKIKRAFEDIQEELQKSYPDKDEVGQALERAIKYAQGANDFSVSTDKFYFHLQKVTNWLGEGWDKLLPLDDMFADL